jgi:vacuolar iron transporter family protein
MMLDWSTGQHSHIDRYQYNFSMFCLKIRMPEEKYHHSHRYGWLRAAVLGANDGVVSTASLIVGVATGHATHSSVLLAGAAGLVAGAMAMAAGEYVSVSSQADAEKADLALEKKGLEANSEAEHRELAAIYIKRGLNNSLAMQVATELMAHDALGAHAREELGISETLRARPLQAAVASAAAFSMGAAVPLLTAILVAEAKLIPLVATISIGFLAVLGALAAWAGGASIIKGAVRVLFWGVIAMGLTAVVGALLGRPL